MNDRTPTLKLDMTVVGQPDHPFVHLESGLGMAWTVESRGLLPVPGGCVALINLQGRFLEQLSRADRHQLLRRARRLLAPGGRLLVPVGTKEGRYPRHELEKEAWVCGFEAGNRVVRGLAELIKPRHKMGTEPPVSILIPAYKSDHFREALDSALAQTWPCGEIIVADDSPDGVIASLVEDARRRVPAGWTLRYLRNRGTIGGRRNYLQLFEQARGPLVKYLNDDDVLAPHCLARMAAVLVHNPGVTLVTSYRRLIDAQGDELPDRPFNEPVLDEDGIVDGRLLANLVLSQGVNLIGEPTTTMFRKADVVDNKPHLMSYAGRSARRNGDMSIWTTLLSRGDGAWLAEPLSFFRCHDGQFQRNEDFKREANQAWTELREDGEDTGLVVEDPDDVQEEPLADLQAKPLADGSEVPRLLKSAARALQSGDRPGARRALEQAVAEDPYGSRARGQLARLEWWEGRRDPAVFGTALALKLAGGRADQELAAGLRDMLGALGMDPRQAAAIAARGAGESDRVPC